MALSEEVVDDYKRSLRDLNFNSKPLINMLTMLAEDHEQHAPEIVAVIEEHITKCKKDRKLPALYLIDSIMKNLEKTSYRSLFTRNIVQTFTTVFEQVDEKTRASMFKLRQTWSALLSNQKLYMIDVKIKKMLDPAWPITATPGKGSIHVNPKFLQAQTSESERESPDEVVEDDSENQEALMRQQLIAKQQELLKLQQARLELELAEAEEKLKAKKKQTSQPVTSTSKALLLPMPSESDMMPLPEIHPPPRDPRQRPSDPRLRDPRLKKSEPSSSSPSVYSASSTTTNMPPASFPQGSQMAPDSLMDAYDPSVDTMTQFNGLPSGISSAGMPGMGMSYPDMGPQFHGEGHGSASVPHQIPDQFHGPFHGQGPYPGEGHGHFTGQDFQGQQGHWQFQGPGHPSEHVFKGEVYTPENIARFSDDNDSDSSRSSFQEQTNARQHAPPVNIRDPRNIREHRQNINDPRNRRSNEKSTSRPLPSNPKHSLHQAKDPRMENKDPRLKQEPPREFHSDKSKSAGKVSAENNAKNRGNNVPQRDVLPSPRKSSNSEQTVKSRSVSKERENKSGSIRSVSKERDGKGNVRSVSNERVNKGDPRNVSKERENIKLKETFEAERRKKEEVQQRFETRSSKRNEMHIKVEKGRTSRERERSPPPSQRSPKQHSSKTSQHKGDNRDNVPVNRKGIKTEPKSSLVVKPDGTSYSTKSPNTRNRKSDTVPPVKKSTSKLSLPEKQTRDQTRKTVEEKPQQKSRKRASVEKVAQPMDIDDRSYRPSTSSDIEKRMREKEHELDAERAAKKPKLEIKTEPFSDDLEEFPETNMDVGDREMETSEKIEEDISDLFGGEDEDYRSVDPKQLPLKSPRNKGWDQYKAGKDEYRYDIALKKQRQDSIVEQRIKIEEEPQDIDFRVGAPVLQQQSSTSTVEDMEIPNELSVDQHGDILLEAHKRLQEGRITKDEYQDVMKQLGQLVQIHQLQQQEQNRRLSNEGVPSQQVSPDTDSDLRQTQSSDRELAALILSARNETLANSKSHAMQQDIKPPILDYMPQDPFEDVAQPLRSPLDAPSSEQNPPLLVPKREVRSPDRPLGHFKIPKKTQPDRDLSSEEDQRQELSNLYPQSPVHDHRPSDPFSGGPPGPVPPERPHREGPGSFNRPDGWREDTDPRRPRENPDHRGPPFKGPGNDMPPNHPDNRPRNFDRRGPAPDIRGPPDNQHGPFNDRRGEMRDDDRRGPPVGRRPPLLADPRPPGGPFNDRRGEMRDDDQRGPPVGRRPPLLADPVPSGGPPDNKHGPFNERREMRDEDRRGPPTGRRPPLLADPRPPGGPPDDQHGPVNDRRPLNDRRGEMREDDRRGPPVGRRPPLLADPRPSDNLRVPMNDRKGPEDNRSPRENWSGPSDNRKGPDDHTGPPNDRRGPPNEDMDRRGPPGRPDAPFDRNDGTRPPFDNRRGPDDEFDSGGPNEGPRERSGSFPEQDGRNWRESHDRRSNDWRDREMPLRQDEGPERDPFADNRCPPGRLRDDRGPRGGPDDGPFVQQSRRENFQESDRQGPQEGWRDRKHGRGDDRERNEGPMDWSDMREGPDDRRGPHGDRRPDAVGLHGLYGRPGPPTSDPQLDRDRDNHKRGRSSPRRDGRRSEGDEFSAEVTNVDPKTGLPPWNSVKKERNEPPHGRGRRDGPLRGRDRDRDLDDRRDGRFMGRGGRGRREERANEPQRNDSRIGGPIDGNREPRMDGLRMERPPSPQKMRDDPPRDNKAQGPNQIETYEDKFGDPRYRCFADMGPTVSEEVIIGRRNFEIKLGAPPRRIQWNKGFIEVFADAAKRGIVVDGNLVYKFGERVKEVTVKGRTEKIFYHGRPLSIWFDGQLYEVRVDSPPKQININGKDHRIQIDGRDMMILIDKSEKGKYGGEPRFVFIDDERMEIRFDPPPRTIRIDGNLCELKLNTQQPCVNIQGVLHGIRFDGPPRDVLIDGKLYQIFTDHAVKTRVGAKFHYVALGGPCHELIVDGRWFEVKFNENPKEISFGNTVMMVKLPGQPPDVKILGPIGPPAGPMPNMPMRPPGPMGPGPVPVLIRPGQGPIPMQPGLGPVPMQQGPMPMLRGPGPVPLQQGAGPVPMQQGPGPVPMQQGPSIVPMQQGPPRPLMGGPVMQPMMNVPRPGGPMGPMGAQPIGSAPMIPSSAPMPIPTMAPGIPGLQPPGPMSGPPVCQPSAMSNVFSTLFGPPRQPTPAAPAPANPIDIGSLLDKLVTSGIIKKEAEAAPNVESEDAPVPVEQEPPPRFNDPRFNKGPKEVFADIPEMTDFDPVLMKSLPVGAIQRLYAGVQCTSCGERFNVEDDQKSEIYKQHLDWHFRTNKKGKDDTRVAQCRRWYYGIDDWIQYEDVIEATEEGKSNFFDQQQQQPSGGATPTKTQSQLALLNVPEGVSVIRCPAATGNDNEDLCNICREPFEQFWEEELEEWHLRDAIKVNNKTYHPICYEDYTDVSEGTPSPSVLNVTEPSFTPRKNLTYDESSQDGHHMSFEEERKISTDRETTAIKSEPAEDSTDSATTGEQSTSNINTDITVKSEPKETVRTENEETTSESTEKVIPKSENSDAPVTIKEQPLDSEMEVKEEEVKEEPCSNVSSSDNVSSSETQENLNSVKSESVSDTAVFDVAIKDEPMSVSDSGISSFSSSQPTSIPGFDSSPEPKVEIKDEPMEPVSDSGISGFSFSQPTSFPGLDSSPEPKVEIKDEPMDTTESKSSTSTSSASSLATEISASSTSSLATETIGIKVESLIESVPDQQVSRSPYETENIDIKIEPLLESIPNQQVTRSPYAEENIDIKVESSLESVPDQTIKFENPASPVVKLEEEDIESMRNEVDTDSTMQIETIQTVSVPVPPTDPTDPLGINTSRSPSHLGLPATTGIPCQLSPTSFSRLSQVNLAVKQEPININPEVLEIGSNASTPTRDELPSPEGESLT